MNVEDVFSSKLRMKILKIISQVGEVNITEVARRLSVNFNTANKHLIVLEEEEIVQHKRFGRIRLYRFNQNSSKAKAIQNLLEIWEQQKK